MRIALTGATGLVGHFVLDRLRRDGHALSVLGRRGVAGARHLPYDLDGPVPDLSRQDALVHMALAHLPGRYRGGEGDDPAGFRRRNVAGTRRLADAARAAGIGRAVFLSSRAVYGDYPPGTTLRETMPPRPDTEYGRAKRDGEAIFAGHFERAVSLRATGVYGPAPPGAPHKWADLFAAWRAGESVAPRVASEVHGADLAAAVALVLRCGRPPSVLNVSDVVLDRHDLLAMAADAAGIALAPPPRGDRAGLNVMATDRLAALGWRPGGTGALARTLPALLAPEAPA